MAELRFNPFSKEEAAIVIKVISSIHGAMFSAPIVPAPVAAPIVPAPVAAPVAAPIVPAPVAAPVAAPVVTGEPIPTDSELQKIVQTVVTLGATKGVGVPQVLGVLKQLGVNRISELGQEARVEFKRLAEALVA